SFSSAQKAADLNVVIVGWNDASTQLDSLTDSKGNLYQLAVGPTVLTGSVPISQAIYYARNIAAASAGANVVTAKFNAAASFVDLRALEYSGVDPLNALDVSAAATGNSASTNSGAVITKNAKDLLVGANMVWTGTSGPGPGSTKRLITSPDGDIAQDQIVSVVGSYSAAAPLNSAGPWVMQMVAFRAAGSPATTPTPTPTPTPKPTPTPTPVPSPTPASSASLAWNANTATTNVNTNAVGYKLHTGFSSGNYTLTSDLGKTTAATVQLTKSGSTYFSIGTAYNAAGTESPVSNQISVLAP